MQLNRPRSVSFFLALTAICVGCSSRGASASYASYARSASSGGMPSSSAASVESPQSYPSADGDSVASVAPTAPSRREDGVRSRAAGQPTPARAAHNVATTVAQTNTGADTRAGSVEQAPASSMIIYAAQIHAQVDHVPAAIDQIIEAISTQGGFLATRNDTSVTMRVPVGRFREALGRIEALGTVIHRDVQAEDVSESFHDLEVHLQNLRSVQTRLQQFLARAANVNDALTVERELERVGGQIDEIEGRMRFLSNRASFSTISVMLTARPVPLTVNPHPTPNSYQPLPDINLPFEVLEQLGLPRLLSVR